MKPTGIKVFAPATVANVACGFDILGFALQKPGDEIIARLTGDSKGLRITAITGAQGKLPYEVEKNTAGVAALRLLEHLGETTLGIELEIHKKMPFGSGLGSSAASAVAAVVVVNELLKRPLERRALLPFAVQGEQIASGSLHADNVAPSLLGGMIFIRSNATLDIHRVPVPRGLYAAVIYPRVEVLTKDARNMLQPNITLRQHIEQSGNLGGLLLGLFHGNLELIKRSMQDVIIEPQRAALIPHFYDVQRVANEGGALGCSISGAGPSIFALCPNSFVAENVGLAMQSIFTKNKIKNELFISPINQEGAILL